MAHGAYYIGFAAEGSTDRRFMSGVAGRLVNEIAFHCHGDFDVEVYVLDITKVGYDSFVDYVKAASAKGVSDYGIHALMMHVDADKTDYESRLETHFRPATEALSTLDESDFCKLLIPVVPVHMSEAWMLADKQLLKEEIGTSLDDARLGFDKKAENVADPKALIEEAIKIAKKHDKRIDVEISDLYSIIGGSIGLDKLRVLESFRQFETDTCGAFRSLGLL